MEKQVQKLDEYTAKSFGGCLKCYGKGYASYTEHHSGRGEADMGEGHIVVDVTIDSMKFCDCSRGQQLRSYVSREKIKSFNEGSAKNKTTDK